MSRHLRTHHHRYRHPHREGQVRPPTHLWPELYHQQLQPQLAPRVAGGDFQSFGMSWKFTYGLWNNLEVYAVIPYIHNWAGNVEAPDHAESAPPISEASAIST